MAYNFIVLPDLWEYIVIHVAVLRGDQCDVFLHALDVRTIDMEDCLSCETQ